MNKIILDYSDYYEDTHEYSKKGNVEKILTQEYKVPNDINTFFNKRGYCPFCKKIYLQFMRIQGLAP